MMEVDTVYDGPEASGKDPRKPSARHDATGGG
jgi:hypothetical protein